MRERKTWAVKEKKTGKRERRVRDGRRGRSTSARERVKESKMDGPGVRERRSAMEEG